MCALMLSGICTHTKIYICMNKRCIGKRYKTKLYEKQTTKKVLL